MNPYKGLPDFHFWSKSVTYPHFTDLDPVSRHAIIRKSDRISSMGSCFAQHIANHLRISGLNYFVPECAPTNMDPAEATKRNYGVFSARYGNLYTVEQAKQLFDRAFGTFTPKMIAWRGRRGFVDPFRPRIEPEEFESVHELIRSRDSHMEKVRVMFRESEWFIFTLGLTEAWRSREDQAVFPLAPGVAGGVFDDKAYEFKNFSASEISDSLCDLIKSVRLINSNAKFILTVSPVPLIATYESRHVLVSTTVSKSALRVAADQAERTLPEVYYFPSYEIITSPSSGGQYYEDDLREVKQQGVAHVMRIFSKHFVVPANQESSPVGVLTREGFEQSDIVCEEALIERAIVES